MEISKKKHSTLPVFFSRSLPIARQLSFTAKQSSEIILKNNACYLEMIDTAGTWVFRIGIPLSTQTKAESHCGKKFASQYRVGKESTSTS